MNEQLITTKSQRSNGSLVVQLSGEIDLSNAHEVQRRLEEAIQGAHSVVIDLSEIGYLDSQGLRVIKQLVNRAARHGTRLQVVAPPDSFARQVLEITQMSDFFEIRDTLGV